MLLLLVSVLIHASRGRTILFHFFAQNREVPRSVFAIEIPPDIHSNGEGGKAGQTVSFRYNLANADQTGTWYNGTDQELNLTAPLLCAASRHRLVYHRPGARLEDMRRS